MSGFLLLTGVLCLLSGFFGGAAAFYVSGLPTEKEIKSSEIWKDKEKPGKILTRFRLWLISHSIHLSLAFNMLLDLKDGDVSKIPQMGVMIAMSLAGWSVGFLFSKHILRRFVEP